MIAILSDIHGNIHALDAVLADMPKEVSEIIILGDMIGGLPANCEVLDRIMNLQLPLTAILGNWEENLFDGKNGQHPEWWQSTQFATLAWTIDNLQPKHWAFLEALSNTQAFDKIINGAFLFHGKPNDSMNGIHTKADAKEAAAYCSEKWLLCGHTHQSRAFRIGHQRIVTVGSVGLSMDFIGGTACYTLLDRDKISIRHVAYDVDAAIASLQTSELARLAPGFSAANALAADIS